MFLLALVGCGEILPPPVEDASEESATTADAGVVVVQGSSSGSRVDSATRSDAGAVASTVPTTAPEDAGCVSIQHHNGLGQTYLSCAPLGTWDEASAWAACRAYVKGGGGSCQVRSGGSCAGAAIVSVGMIANDATNASWDFGAGARGHVSTYPNAAPLGCPSTTDPTWN